MGIRGRSLQGTALAILYIVSQIGFTLLMLYVAATIARLRVEQDPCLLREPQQTVACQPRR